MDDAQANLQKERDVKSLGDELELEDVISTPEEPRRRECSTRAGALG